MLALLALRLGEVVSVGQLIDAGWGDDLPANPANTLQYQVAQLRKIIEPEAGRPRHLLTVSPGYRLDPATVTSDAQEFLTHVAAAREAFEASRLNQATTLVEAALAMWRGPALAEFRYDEFAFGDAERLESERLAAIELRVDITLAAGRHNEAVSELGQLTAEHPLREGLWSRRVLALYRSGQQSAALRCFQDAREALADVGLVPGTELQELESRVLVQDETLSPQDIPPATTSNNLPAPPNRLIGREADVENVRRLLDDGRTVTLLGPGGAGKTRLAIAVADTLLDRYPGGVWFVPLENFDDGSLLAAEVGRISGMREHPSRPVLDTLADHLGRKQTLLVLDNCEHVIGSSATFVQDLTTRCGQLSVLATSQVTLDTGGEVVFTVTPLALPGQTTSIYDPITDIDAVALFVERARDAGAPVEGWDEDDLATVANIVTALDGLPLALELAAARTRSMSLDEIARGLNDRFVTLSRGPRTAPARQRSLLGAVEWSLNLLGDHEREVVAKLSVFAGSFDAEDAAAVVGGLLTSVHDDLAMLVDRSLLARRGDVAGRARFVMLESLRQHGLASLGPKRLEETRHAHLSHFNDFVQAADVGLRCSEQLEWLHRIDAAYDNIRSALAWSLSGGSQAIGIQITASLGRYWDWRGLLKDGSAWTDRITIGDFSPMIGLATTLAWKSFSAWEYGDLEVARSAMELAIDVAEALDDPREPAAALTSQLLISRSLGDLDSARLEGAALSHAAELVGDTWLKAWSESALATVELAAGNFDAAQAYALRCMTLFDELGDRRGETWGSLSLAQVELGYNKIDDAERHVRRALVSATATEDDRSVLWAVEILAEIAHRHGDLERSARLWGAAHPMRESRGLAGSVSKLSEPTDLEIVLRAELGAQFDSLADGGRDNSQETIADELQSAARRGN